MENAFITDKIFKIMIIQLIESTAFFLWMQELLVQYMNNPETVGDTNSLLTCIAACYVFESTSHYVDKLQF